MEYTEVRNKKTHYKKIICIAILLITAVYCIPELQEKVISGIDALKNMRRKIK